MGVGTLNKVWIFAAKKKEIEKRKSEQEKLVE